VIASGWQDKRFPLPARFQQRIATAFAVLMMSCAAHADELERHFLNENPCLRFVSENIKTISVNFLLRSGSTCR
jgi:hypothetical protein